MHTIQIEEIPVEQIEEFWNIHIRYLLEDGIITDEEDIEYFQSAEYRDIIKAHMLRPVDKHHMVYFIRSGVRIGAAQYNTYQSEDGKCFLLEFGENKDLSFGRCKKMKSFTELYDGLNSIK